MDEISASSHKVLQSQNVLESISQNPSSISNPSMPSPSNVPNSPSIDISQIPSPSLPPLPQISSYQQQQISPIVGLDYPQKQQSHQPSSTAQLLRQQQQHSNSIGAPNFQLQQSLQRTASLTRPNQHQPQHQPQQQPHQLYGSLGGAMRQQTGGVCGQMNFGGQQQLPPGTTNLARSSLIGQGGQLPMLSGQAAVQFSLQQQQQLLTSPRQKSGLTQGAQFHPANSPAQSLQAIQAMGSMGSMGLNSHLRVNGSLNYSQQCQQQRVNQGQTRQQPSQQTSISQTQSLPRNSQLVAALSPNGQQELMQNSRSQQHWSKQMPGSTTSYRLPTQRQHILHHPQMTSSSPQLHPNSMPLSPQQLSQLMQNQSSMGHPQQEPQLLVQPQQQQSPKLPGPASQKSLSLTGSQPNTTISGVTTPGGSSSQGTEATNQLLGKRKIQDLVSQVDSHGKVDLEVEDLLLEIADDFIDSVTTFACTLAKHRNSSILESKDILLHLEKNWNLNIPGYSIEEHKHQRKFVSSDAHQKRVDMIHALMGSETNANHLKELVPPALNNSNSLGTNHLIKSPSSSSDNLLSHPTGPQMLQQITRF